MLLDQTIMVYISLTVFNSGMSLIMKDLFRRILKTESRRTVSLKKLAVQERA